MKNEQRRKAEGEKSKKGAERQEGQGAIEMRTCVIILLSWNL
jgi:hypothetical protein